MYPSCILDQVVYQVVKDEDEQEEGFSPGLRGRREMVQRKIT